MDTLTKRSETPPGGAPGPCVTLRDLAGRAGLSKSAVSLALRGSPKVAEATRARVRAVAEACGYRPDPLVARLATRRWRRAAAGDRLALLHGAVAAGGAESTRLERFAAAAGQVAASLGYRLDRFPADRVGWAALLRMLHHRGYPGLILFEWTWRESWQDLPWEKFSVVGVRTSFDDPPFDTVKDDVFGALLLVWRQVRERGYRRPGLALFEEWPSRDRALREGASALLERLWPASDSAVPLLETTADPAGRARFLRWWRRHRPDAVIGQTGLFHWWMREAGGRIPQETGFASLGDESEDSGLSGIRVPYDQAGRCCLQLLDNRLRHHQTGLSDRPWRLDLLGDWREGRTLRPPGSA